MEVRKVYKKLHHGERMKFIEDMKIRRNNKLYKKICSEITLDEILIKMFDYKKLMFGFEDEYVVFFLSDEVKNFLNAYINRDYMRLDGRFLCRRTRPQRYNGIDQKYLDILESSKRAYLFDNWYPIDEPTQHSE